MDEAPELPLANKAQRDITECRRPNCVLGMFTEPLTKEGLYAIRTEVMHGLLEQRWLATASHDAALWARLWA